MFSTRHESGSPQHALTPRRWSVTSIAALIAAWLVLQLGGLFSPGLLDDVDSIYIQIAREMLQHHDFITPTIDGVRFFDKPPLLYSAIAMATFIGPYIYTRFYIPDILIALWMTLAVHFFLIALDRISTTP